MSFSVLHTIPLSGRAVVHLPTHLLKDNFCCFQVLAITNKSYRKHLRAGFCVDIHFQLL